MTTDRSAPSPVRLTVTPSRPVPSIVTAPLTAAVRSAIPSKGTSAVSARATVTFREVTAKPYSSVS